MPAFDQLVAAMVAGRHADFARGASNVRDLLDDVYNERYHNAGHFRGRFQTRVNLQQKEDAASYAGWITAENPTSGPYQGTSFVWFPGEKGSVAVLVIGTDGFGADSAILGRPGHGRRLRALSRLHRGRLWAKPDLLDTNAEVPLAVSSEWPKIDAALRAYGKVVYAAAAVNESADAAMVSDLLDLFFHEHGIPLTGTGKQRWEDRLSAIAGATFPKVTDNEILALLRQRRYVVLEGPPGTGKTRLAYRVAKLIGSHTAVQFHAARTYEDFVVGLFPRPTENGLAFEVRPGDLLRANRAASVQPHLLLIDEINRADLSRVLGEAMVLFEVGETGRTVRLPHTPEGYPQEIALTDNLFVLGTRNTADRTISKIDIAVRRRFAFMEMWPDLEPVENEGVSFARELFTDAVHTFMEFADDEVLRLVPGHAYFLDPRPDLGAAQRPHRVRQRLQYELLPLLRYYVDERLGGAATEIVAGLADRLEGKLLGLEGLAVNG